MSIPILTGKRTAVLFLALLAGAGVFLALGPGKHPHPHFYLCVSDFETGKTLYRTPVEPGEEVLLGYIHSADKTPVTLVFRVEESGKLRLMEERYSWYGAGLEAGSGYRFDFEGDEVVVSGYDSVHEALPLRVARTVPQVLEAGGEEVRLSDLAPGGTRLVLEVVH